MNDTDDTTSIILAAGRGSRMKAYEGNKTLLPLIPNSSPFSGDRPILIHILESLPPGPKALIVNYQQEAVMAATRHLQVSYCHQPVLNGTGGALLAARPFLEQVSCSQVIITMGDVPFVKSSTYETLLKGLSRHPIMALGFRPQDRKQYGVLEIEGNEVHRITEWKYWKSYPPETLARLNICNAGIYAARRDVLLRYLPVLAARPQKVLKEREGRMVEIEEYFITDIVEYMRADGLSAGYAVTESEMETMGIDDPTALEAAQSHYREMLSEKN